MTTDRLLGMVPPMPEGQRSSGDAPMKGQGRLIGRRYRLLSPVGRGGMGMVWHAHDELLDRDVAVKELILPFGLDHAGTQAAYRRVLREARSAARLSHPGIITVHDVVEEDGRPWIVMELVRAWSLEQAVRHSGPLPVVQAAEIGIRVLDALRHAHAAGILHRDVKPGNVLLTNDRVVLTDFGIAAVEGEVTITQTGILMGSPAYIPPERLQGRPITPAADLWSFGATLYTAVEGRPPYEGPDAVAVLGAVLTQDPAPPQRAGALLPVIQGLLRKNPADRLPAAQVHEMLEQILRSHGAGAPYSAATPLSAPTPQDALPAGLLPPLDFPSGPNPMRIIETPSGPVRVPVPPEELSSSGPHAMPQAAAPEAPPAARPSLADAWPRQDTGPVSRAAAERGGGEGRTDGEHRDGPAARARDRRDASRDRDHRDASRDRDRRDASRDRDRHDGTSSGRDVRSVLLTVVTAAAVLGLLVTLLLVLLPGGDPAEEDREPAAVAQPTAAATPEARESVRIPDPPKGYRTHTEGGISVAVPKNWTVSESEGALTFTGPRQSGQKITIEEITDGSLAALQATEQQLDVGKHPDYTQIRLDSVNYRWPAADWEYTYTDDKQVTIHVVVRYVQAGGKAYAITFSSPDYDWNESAARVRQVLWNTFTPV